YNDISVRGTVPIYVNNFSIPFIKEHMGSYSGILEFIFVDADLIGKISKKDISFIDHPVVKLFITHGGLFGFQDAVYCGIRLLGISQYGDEELNLKISESLHCGMIINYEDLTEISFNCSSS
ncbi:hypothetical protein ILUMI_18323, partial [Ignelater luminosus]